MLTSKELSLEPPGFDLVLLLSACPGSKSSFLRCTGEFNLPSVIFRQSLLDEAHDERAEGHIDVSKRIRLI